MVMDPNVFDSINGLRVNTESESDENLMSFFRLEEYSLGQNLMDQSPNFSSNTSGIATSSSSSSSSNVSPSSPEEYDFSDVVLKYINQMLMEEDIEEKNCMFQESSALQAAEKPFYEILRENPPAPHHNPPLYVDHHYPENRVQNFTHYPAQSNNSSNGSNNAVEINWIGELGEYRSLFDTQSIPSDYTFQASPQSSFNPSNGFDSVAEVLVESLPVAKVQVPDMYCESEPIWQFRKGVEEANKFLPNGNNLLLNLESNALFNNERKKEEAGDVLVKLEKKDERETSPNGSRGKKNVHREEIDVEEGRSYKQSAVFSEETIRNSMLDMVLLCKGENYDDKANINLRESIKIEANKNLQQNGQSKGSNGKSRGKKQTAKRDVVDLRTLLIHCAQAVAADDRRTAGELLKQIRQHSSPFGDGSQRLAHCFADGLEARLAGTGSQLYSTLLFKKTLATDILKAYQLYMAACPFKKISNFFSNQTFSDLAETATTLHIVDFGILWGFQWPCLIQRLSNRKGGPPKLRITGIDFPQPGFRPAERVEETGLRLRAYAEEFKVPFEYHAIAQKWETIQLEDLNINKDELLVVNCMYRMRNLLDETVILDSPRNAVLKLVKKMNPAVFVHGIVNGAFSAPFFVTRFREALFHYSSLFDMLEANVPREHPERALLEGRLFGKEAVNVIACEGSERVERPETYKQWQVRNVRAGFVQLPLKKDIMKKVKDKAKELYHKDFVVDEDSQWMLLGWKGRIIYALSSWRPM
ncbi:hypothetical protein MKW98_026390 [Papaver atlanticum]|uniref:Scarecrow-like protein 9 n=1 Tax=Papaver atlanticum TaxID=357466 RepID=A0AAD4SRV2_9MAGN|nr:hypothetical protein MKW98_026390 [Papaver atlanticum]